MKVVRKRISTYKQHASLRLFATEQTTAEVILSVLSVLSDLLERNENKSVLPRIYFVVRSRIKYSRSLRILRLSGLCTCFYLEPQRFVSCPRFLVLYSHNLSRKEGWTVSTAANTFFSVKVDGPSLRWNFALSWSRNFLEMLGDLRFTTLYTAHAC